MRSGIIPKPIPVPTRKDTLSRASRWKKRERERELLGADRQPDNLALGNQGHHTCWTQTDVAAGT